MKIVNREVFEVADDAAEGILRRCLEQIHRWGLNVSEEDPLLLHFGYQNFFRIGETEFLICNEIEHGYCGKFIFLFDNQRCPNHHHKRKHETFHIVKGEVVMTINGKDQVLGQGDILAISVGTPHTFVARGGPALLLEVSQPCILGDSYFEDEHINAMSMKWVEG